MMNKPLVKKWAENIRTYENLSYGGLRTLNDIESAYYQALARVDELESLNNGLNDLYNKHMKSWAESEKAQDALFDELYEALEEINRQVVDELNCAEGDRQPVIMLAIVNQIAIKALEATDKWQEPDEEDWRPLPEVEVEG